MKRTLILSIIACGASLALCPVLQAQDTPAPSADTGGGGGHGGGRHGGGMSLEKLTTALTLTSDQQTQIKPILDTERASMQAARSDTTLSQEDKMSKMKDARDTANTAINAILTPDQQTKFAALIANMHSHRGGGGGGAGAAPSAN